MPAWSPMDIRGAWDSFRKLLAEERRSLRGRLMYALLGLLAVLLLLEGRDYFVRLQSRRELLSQSERHASQALEGTGRSIPTIEELKGTRAVVAMEFTPEALGSLVFRREPGRLELLFDRAGRLVASSQQLAPADIARAAAEVVPRGAEVERAAE